MRSYQQIIYKTQQFMSKGETLTNDIGNLLEKELGDVLDSPTVTSDQMNRTLPETNLLTAEAQQATSGPLDSNPTEEDQSGSSPRADSNHDEQEEYFTRDLVEISKDTIQFNKNVLYPGSIDEVELAIGLKDDILPDEDPNSAYLLRVIAICSNKEFNDLDEYVFSVRSNERFEYYEEVRFRIRKKEKAQVRVAVKVPVAKDNYAIEGTLSIQLENTVPVVLPIYSKCQVPKIICMKQLYQSIQNTHVIKIPAKKNMRLPPIPFKNTSNFNFILQVQTATTEDFSDRAYDIVAQSSANCMANSPFFVNLNLKTNMNYRGLTPKIDTIRKILILKVKNSTVYFHYPIEAYVYESNSSSSAS